jgi:putative nucleotidyltransferase with HDIG domain
MGTRTHTEAVLDVLAGAAAAGYIGEPVTQLEHALQCAHFARAAGADDELTLAALLHDIGHLVGTAPMGALGAWAHEEEGARFLAAHGFSPRVAELVRGHVQGKRYLTACHETYRARLSDASRRTLELQGGPMDDAEARAFERDPLFHDKVRLRKLDELAKRPDLAVAPLSSYRPMIEAHVGRIRP